MYDDIEGSGELMTAEYDPEQEREDLMRQAEKGRKYKTAREVLSKVMSTQRNNIINQLETADFTSDGDAMGLVLYLRVLKLTESLIQTEIDKGELAEKELIEDGSE